MPKLCTVQSIKWQRAQAVQGSGREGREGHAFGSRLFAAAGIRQDQPDNIGRIRTTSAISVPDDISHVRHRVCACLCTEPAPAAVSIGPFNPAHLVGCAALAAVGPEAGKHRRLHPLL